MSPVAADLASAASAAPLSGALVPPAEAVDVPDVVLLELLPQPPASSSAARMTAPSSRNRGFRVSMRCRLAQLT
jgi:hypothetical protein